MCAALLALVGVLSTCLALVTSAQGHWSLLSDPVSSFYFPSFHATCPASNGHQPPWIAKLTFFYSLPQSVVKNVKKSLYRLRFLFYISIPRGPSYNTRHDGKTAGNFIKIKVAGGTSRLPTKRRAYMHECTHTHTLSAGS